MCPRAKRKCKREGDDGEHDDDLASKRPQKRGKKRRVAVKGVSDEGLWTNDQVGMRDSKSKADAQRRLKLIAQRETAPSRAGTGMRSAKSSDRPTSIKLFIGIKKGSNSRLSQSGKAASDKSPNDASTVLPATARKRIMKATASLIASLNMDHMTHISSTVTSSLKSSGATSSNVKIPNINFTTDSPSSAPRRMKKDVIPGSHVNNASVQQLPARNENETAVEHQSQVGYPSSRFCKVLRLVVGLLPARSHPPRTRCPSPKGKPPVWAEVSLPNSPSSPYVWICCAAQAECGTRRLSLDKNCVKPCLTIEPFNRVCTCMEDTQWGTYWRRSLHRETFGQLTARLSFLMGEYRLQS